MLHGAGSWEDSSRYRQGSYCRFSRSSFRLIKLLVGTSSGGYTICVPINIVVVVVAVRNIVLVDVPCINTRRFKYRVSPKQREMDRSTPELWGRNSESEWSCHPSWWQPSPSLCSLLQQCSGSAASPNGTARVSWTVLSSPSQFR